MQKCCLCQGQSVSVYFQSTQMIQRNKQQLTSIQIINSLEKNNKNNQPINYQYKYQGHKDT